MIGRSRGEAVAERRREELNRYIWHLTHAAPEVAEVSGLSLVGCSGKVCLVGRGGVVCSGSREDARPLAVKDGICEEGGGRHSEGGRGVAAAPGVVLVNALNVCLLGQVSEAVLECWYSEPWEGKEIFEQVECVFT